MAEPGGSSEDDRAQAVAWYLSSEKSIAEIASELKVSESLVREWVWNASLEDATDDADAEADAEAQADAEVVAFADTAAANAAAVEAVLRAEIMAAEAAARADAVAAEAKAEVADLQAQLAAVRAELEAARAEIAVRIGAEAALREEMNAVYAEAVEALIRAEANADERVARAGTTTPEPLTQAPAADADTEEVAEAGKAEALPAASVFPRPHDVDDGAIRSSEAPSPPKGAPLVAASSAGSRQVDRSAEEAEARAKIAEVMAKAKPVELWVHATGRTFGAACEEALARLGVDEADAEIEMLANGSRWLPGRVQVRARVRGRADLRLITKPAGPGPVASAGPGPADGRG